MESLVYYIVIGAIFMFSIELLMRTKKVEDTRILGILIWPIAMYVFIKAFLKETFKK